MVTPCFVQGLGALYPCGVEFHEMMQKSLLGAQQGVTLIPTAGRREHCLGHTRALTESSYQPKWAKNQL